jgi:hypothetical protein
VKVRRRREGPTVVSICGGGGGRDVGGGEESGSYNTNFFSMMRLNVTQSSLNGQTVAQFELMFVFGIGCVQTAL